MNSPRELEAGVCRVIYPVTVIYSVGYVRPRSPRRSPCRRRPAGPGPQSALGRTLDPTGFTLAASLPALPSIIAFPAFQRQFMRGLTSGAGKR
ncbi:hypothetical protein [Microbispora sp. KK1-11]|uniref:hypothetical protein n=1 Tax=Microbispora sp. KK1-11 TaxID=2053005 RepID=UPI001C8D8376|nr:hypothetical protein [Microbispora sp. KK1-11]